MARVASLNRSIRARTFGVTPISRLNCVIKWRWLQPMSRMIDVMLVRPDEAISRSHA
jgi:hypothetical protein